MISSGNILFVVDASRGEYVLSCGLLLSFVADCGLLSYDGPIGVVLDGKVTGEPVMKHYILSGWFLIHSVPNDAIKPFRKPL
jgi:hypothetical protein